MALLGQDYESLIRRLQALGKKQPLQDSDLAEAKSIMIALRQAGFTNAEVVELSGNAWHEVTIKKYTRGITIEDSTFRDEAIMHLSKMTSMGLTLKNVKTCVSMHNDLIIQNVSFHDMISLLGQAKKAGIGMGSLIDMHRQAGTITRGSEQAHERMSIAQLKELLTFKVALEEAGFVPIIESLKKVITAANTYGNFQSVIQSINAYGSLQDIQTKTSEQEDQSKAFEEAISQLSEKIQSLQIKYNELEDPIREYESLKSKGYDEHTFLQIDELTIRHGGVKEAIQSVSEYANLKDLQKEIASLQIIKSNIESKIKELNAENAHLQTLLAMCDKLLYELKFSVSAIQDLTDIARRYGQPMDVFIALARYGSINALEQAVSELEGKKTRLEARVAELETRDNQMNGQVEAIKEIISGAINPINKALDQTLQQFNSTYKMQLDLMKREYDEHVKRLGNSVIFEEELNLARIIRSIIKFPSELTQLPIDYAAILIDGAIRFCIAKGVNPKISLLNLLGQKYSFSTSTMIDSLHLLETSKSLLQTGLR